MTPTKKETHRPQAPVETTKNAPEGARPTVPKEPVTLDLLDVLLGNSDDDVRAVATHAGDWIEDLLDLSALPTVMPSLGRVVRDNLDRIHALIGNGAKVGLVVVLSDRDRFDDINLPGQLNAGCDEHGLCLKVYSEEDLKIVLMNVETKTPPPAFAPHAASSRPHMSHPDDRPCRRAAHA